MIERLCPRVPSQGNYIGMVVVLVFALGSLLGGVRMLSTLVRPHDPWTRLGLSDRLLVGALALVGGIVGVLASLYALLYCS